MVYHPFSTGAANWVYRYYDDFHYPTSIFTPYSLFGDTTISTINYRKVFKYVYYAGALREDNKIIYFVPDTSSTEYLLYNFNLNVGDSIIHPYGGAVCTNDTLIVWNVDSVMASDGYHRRLWFNSNAQWIEGIGAVYYLLEPCNVLCVSGNDYLECISTDSSLNYPSGYLSCMVSVPELSIENSKISINPNPVANELTVKTNLDHPLEFKLYDITSRKILSKTFNNSTIINLEHLTSGVYLYEVESKDGVVKKGVVVKE